MAAAMTIRLTEDDDPNGYVTVDFDIDGFELEGAEDSDLPAALLLGAKMVQLSRDLPDTGPADPAVLRLWGQEN